MPAAIREMSADERPRERLQSHRPEALATRELLAVVLGSGSSGRSALYLASALLARYDGSLRRMGRAEPDDLRGIRGVGPARAASVAAALELGRRAAAEPARAERRIRAPRDVHRRLGPVLRDRTQEEFWALYLYMHKKLCITRRTE